MRTTDVLLILLTLIFPPATAAILTGCSCELLISIGLTILGFIPGHIYSLYLIYKKVQAEERFGDCKYVGNGEYAPLDGGSNQQRHMHYPTNPPVYGATQ